MKKTLIFSLAICTLASCNLSNKKQDLATSFSEKILEKATGQKVSAPNLSNVDKTKVKVQLSMNSEDLPSMFSDAKANVVLLDGALNITIAQEEDGAQKGMLVNFSSRNLESTKPIKGSTKENENNGTGLMVTISSLSESEIYGYLMQEGTAELESFNEKEIVLKLNGKMSTASHAEQPDKWENIEGKIIIEYPVISSLGQKKEIFFY